MTQKPLSYLFFKVMWPDCSNIMHETEWIIQCIFSNYKRLGESDNSSMPDKGSVWIRDAENRGAPTDSGTPAPFPFSHGYLLYPVCPKKISVVQTSSKEVTGIEVKRFLMMTKAGFLCLWPFYDSLQLLSKWTLTKSVQHGRRAQAWRGITQMRQEGEGCRA